MVIFDGDKRVFKLDTDNTSYVMGITEEGYLGNIYYGKKVDSTDLGCPGSDDGKGQAVS